MLRTAIILILMTSHSFAQCNYLFDEVDDFTGKVEKGTKRVRIATMDFGFYLRFSLVRSGDKIFIATNGNDDLGCATKESYVSLKLLDGEVITSYNFGDIDCSERPQMYFMLDQEQIQKLKASAIDKIRLSGSELTIDSRKVRETNYFIDTIKCLED